VGLGLGLGAALASVGLVAAPGALSGNGGVRQVLVGSELGYRLELPVGWQRLTREQLAPHLTLPQATLTGSAVGFGDAARGRYGMLWVERAPGQALPAGCQGLLRALGAGTSSVLPLPAPPALGSRTQVHALSAAGGARGVLGCGLLSDGRLVGLAVVASSAEGASTVDAVREEAFRAVGSGLVLQ